MKKLDNSLIYLDNQATTPLDKRVLESMMPYLTDHYGNPHSNDHIAGWQTKKAVDQARAQIADFLNADPNEIFFTSGATEANNLAILGALPHLQETGKTKIVVSSFEHKCVLESVKAAESQGFEIAYLPPNKDGFIQAADLESVIDDSVGLVSVMTVNNEIGTLQPIFPLSEVAANHGALFHTDAAQASIFHPINLSEGFTDLLSISAHKIYGPKGIGALYIKRDAQAFISPIIHGGGQEGGIRSGTLPTMLCVGIGKACQLAKQERAKNVEHLKALSTSFWDQLSKLDHRLVINGDTRNRHPGNLNIRFSGIDGHSLINALQPHIAASTGSACTSGTPEPSYVLRTIGLSEVEARSSIRFSFGLQNTPSEINTAVEHIDYALGNLDSAELRSIA